MGRFDDRATEQRGPKDLLKWKLLEPLKGRAADRPKERFVPPVRPGDPRLLDDGAALAWIGHATFAMRLGGALVVTDPVFSNRIAGAVPRLAPPGLDLDALPSVDVVTVSHDHYDHMDMPSLKRIGPEALYVTPLGCGDLLARAGLTRVVELDWWQSTRQGDLEITLVPARHWSMRAPWSRNSTLWGGFVLRGPEGAAYHAGDTAYFDGFAEIAERAGPIDWALLPIGAYEPRWFMEAQHMNPDDAGRAFQALRARTLVAMHWGTFKLTDEHPSEPPTTMRFWWETHGLDPARLWIMDIGEVRQLGR